MVDAAVVVLAGDQLEQRHPHAVLHGDHLRRRVARVPPETERVDCDCEGNGLMDMWQLHSKWTTMYTFDILTNLFFVC